KDRAFARRAVGFDSTAVRAYDGIRQAEPQAVTVDLRLIARLISPVKPLENMRHISSLYTYTLIVHAEPQPFAVVFDAYFDDGLLGAVFDRIIHKYDKGFDKLVHIAAYFQGLFCRRQLYGH